jgi:hypothetical protein
MTRSVLAGAIALTLVTPVAALAQSNPELEALKAQVAALNQKIVDMEAREAEKAKVAPAPAVAPAAKEAKPASSWTDKVAVTGDFRYRFDGIDEENLKYSGKQSIRARLNVNAKVNDTTNVVMQLGTGGAAPRTQEATLGGDGTGKEISLRQAYVNWKPVKDLAVVAGKMPTPWAVNSMDYFHDTDYYVEGIGVKYGAAKGFYGSGYWLQVAERGSFDDETSILGGQVGYANDLFYANVGYQDFQNAKGYNPCYNGNCNGNTLVGGVLANDYNLVQARAGVMFAGFTLFGSWDQNLEADAEDTAYSLGVTYGKVADAGSWSVGALYQDVEKDALYGGMLDATFAGGKTAHDGYVLTGAYGLSKSWSVTGLWFVNSVAKDANEHDYDRFQVDLLWKF